MDNNQSLSKIEFAHAKRRKTAEISAHRSQDNCSRIEEENIIARSSRSGGNASNQSITPSRGKIRYTSLKVRTKTMQYSSDRSQNMWISQVIEAITESNLDQIPPSDVLFRLSQKIEELAINPKQKRSFTVEETVKLYLNLNITQARFQLLLTTLKEEGLSPFPSYNSVKEVLATAATGSYKCLTYNQLGMVEGIIATDIESIVRERVVCLMSTRQLVYENTENGNEISINCCINGDKGQDSTKFNLQLETKESNHSVNNLSIIALWFGSDERKYMEFFLEEPMKKFDDLVRSGFYIEINGLLTKVVITPYIVADFLVLYNFFGLKGPSSNHNCAICERVSGGTRNRITIQSSDRNEEYNYRSLTSCNKDLGYKEYTLSKTIPYENICIPMLHVFMGLVKKMYDCLTDKINSDSVNGTLLSARLDNFIKTFHIPIQEFYQTFSGNGVHRFLENIDQFECIFESIEGYDKYINTFRKIRNIYKVVSKVNRSNKNELSKAIAELHAEYEDFGDIYLTPKLHALLHHSEKELERNGKLSLFSEQGLESQHSLIKKDVIRYQSLRDNHLKLNLIIRHNYLRTKFHDKKI
uniref:C2H2-type domain-containing protein n=1 Tax=Strongyloides papillosus TaxID=174720 RepID=A0A0N5BT26_STREA